MNKALIDEVEKFIAEFPMTVVGCQGVAFAIGGVTAIEYAFGNEILEFQEKLKGPILELRKMVWDHICKNSGGRWKEDSPPTHWTITKYQGKARRLTWHRDNEVEHYEDIIVGVSMGAEGTLEISGEGSRRDVETRTRNNIQVPLRHAEAYKFHRHLFHRVWTEGDRWAITFRFMRQKLPKNVLARFQRARTRDRGEHIQTKNRVACPLSVESTRRILGGEGQSWEEVGSGNSKELCWNGKAKHGELAKHLAQECPGGAVAILLGRLLEEAKWIGGSPGAKIQLLPAREVTVFRLVAVTGGSQLGWGEPPSWVNCVSPHLHFRTLALSDG